MCRSPWVWTEILSNTSNILTLQFLSRKEELKFELTDQSLRTFCHQWNIFSSRLSGLPLDGFSTRIEFQGHLSFFTRKDFYSPVCLTFGGVEIICHYIIACLNCRNVAICCHTFGECTDLSSLIVRWRYVPCSPKVTFGHLELPTRILLWLLVNWFLVTSIRHTFFF